MSLVTKDMILKDYCKTGLSLSLPPNVERQLVVPFPMVGRYIHVGPDTISHGRKAVNMWRGYVPSWDHHLTLNECDIFKCEFAFKTFANLHFVYEYYDDEMIQCAIQNIPDQASTWLDQIIYDQIKGWAPERQLKHGETWVWHLQLIVWVGVCLFKSLCGPKSSCGKNYFGSNSQKGPIIWTHCHAKH